MIKRILSLVLSLAIILCSFSVINLTSSAAGDETLSVLASLVKKFPAGKYWNHMGSDENNPDGVTDTPCKSHSGCSWVEGACSCNSFDRAIQCMGYAHKIAYEITGYSPRASFTKSTTLSASKLRVGDIIRFRNDRHSICVTGVSGQQISFTDCNWATNCIIRWGTMDISYLKERGFTYVLHLEGNDRKNTDLTFYENPDKYISEEDKVPAAPPTVPAVSGEETWKMSDSNLNVRNTASVSGTKVGSIPANSEFKVTNKKIADGYLWGYVKYGSVKGWAALDYSEYKSGYYQKPDVENTADVYNTDKITFTWNEVSGADYYLFKLYDSNKQALLEKTVSDNKYTVNLSEAGDYYVRVFTRSDHASSWKISGTLKSFSYETEESACKIEKVTLSKSTLTFAAGKTYTLTATTSPSGMTDSLVWSSSDKGVVTVEKGKLRTVDCGKATVICSDKSGKVKASCEVTVKPGNITGAAQDIGKTKLTSITFSWNKTSCADGYVIHRYNSSEKKYEKLGTVEGTSYTDNNVSYGKNYYYLIRAVADTDSGDITGSSVKTKCSTKPGKPTGLKQSSSATGTFTLTWKKSRNASYYEVYKYDSAKKKYIKTDTVKETKSVVNTTPGEKAYYRVYAYTETDWGVLKSSASDKAYTIAGPSKPTLSVKSSSKGTATLKWKSVENATHYVVFRNTSSGYKKLATVKKGTTSYTDKSLKSGSKQQYRVRAITVKGGVTGYGSYSAKKSVTVK